MLIAILMMSNVNSLTSRGCKNGKYRAQDAILSMNYLRDQGTRASIYILQLDIP